MPIYEFRCKSCGKEFERLIFAHEGSDKQVCPVCKGDAERVMSPFCSMRDQAGALRTSSQSCGTSRGFS